MKSHRHLAFLVLATATLSLGAGQTVHASNKQLWNGLVSFNMPRNAAISEASEVEWGDESFLVRAGGQGRNAAALVYREDLDAEEASLSTKRLSQEFKKQLEAAGLRVGKLRVGKNEVTCTISGKADVPWSKKRVSASGVVRAVRVKPSLVVGAIAFSETADFAKAFVKPFRQIVSTFKVTRGRDR